MFYTAEAEELIESSPCKLTRDILPPSEDADPEWRQGAVFSKAEVERLIGDERIPLDRHVFYAIESLAGLRHGEACGLRWRHYDPEVKPLGRLTIATSYDTGRTKTRKVRMAPVHPVLAALLAEWRLSGWSALFGCSPQPDDLIVPLEPDGKKKRARKNPRACGMRKQERRGQALADRSRTARTAPSPRARPPSHVHHAVRG
jgi:integrase